VSVFGGHEPVFPGGVGSVGNAQKLVNVTKNEPPDFSVFGFCNRYIVSYQQNLPVTC
jgi:hypothetical protein